MPHISVVDTLRSTSLLRKCSSLRDSRLFQFSRKTHCSEYRDETDEQFTLDQLIIWVQTCSERAKLCYGRRITLSVLNFEGSVVNFVSCSKVSNLHSVRWKSSLNQQKYLGCEIDFTSFARRSWLISLDKHDFRHVKLLSEFKAHDKGWWNSTK